MGNSEYISLRGMVQCLNYKNRHCYMYHLDSIWVGIMNGIFRTKYESIVDEFLVNYNDVYDYYIKGDRPPEDIVRKESVKKRIDEIWGDKNRDWEHEEPLSDKDIEIYEVYRTAAI